MFKLVWGSHRAIVESGARAETAGGDEAVEILLEDLFVEIKSNQQKEAPP